MLGLATRLRDTAFKKTLAELDVGAEVDVEEPKGDFSLPMETDRPYAFIAGGIGITVFRSMLRYIVEEGLPHRVTLIYSNRDRESARRSSTSSRRWIARTRTFASSSS